MCVDYHMLIIINPKTTVNLSVNIKKKKKYCHQMYDHPNAMEISHNILSYDWT